MWMVWWQPVRWAQRLLQIIFTLKGALVNLAEGLDLESGDLSKAMGRSPGKLTSQFGATKVSLRYCKEPPQQCSSLAISQSPTIRTSCCIPHAVPLVPPRSFNDQARRSPAYHLARRARMAALGYHMDDLADPLGEIWT